MLDSPIQYPEPTSTTPAAQRTPQEWVDYYLEIESQVAEGKEVNFDNGRRVLMEDLAEIRKSRHEWERKAARKNAARSGGKRIGGLGYKTANMTQ